MIFFKEFEKSQALLGRFLAFLEIFNLKIGISIFKKVHMNLVKS